MKLTNKSAVQPSQVIGFLTQIPRFPWNNGISLSQLPFGVRSCEVAIIWPDLHALTGSLRSMNSHLPHLPSQGACDMYANTATFALLHLSRMPPAEFEARGHRNRRMPLFAPRTCATVQQIAETQAVHPLTNPYRSEPLRRWRIPSTWPLAPPTIVQKKTASWQMTHFSFSQPEYRNLAGQSLDIFWRFGDPKFKSLLSRNSVLKQSGHSISLCFQSDQGRDCARNTTKSTSHVSFNLQQKQPKQAESKDTKIL